ncbi:Gfo/Idh/MocA family oxidoreductase [Chitinophagaceae bacterium LB-8]|uniref:Gfo/Idh/MocA family oxidoreductase n=1 Tax=Paraflavisolibacter caeni TaxID=2982496 RepID=A0A9X2XWF0_9BACT|nr:putative oxidoreductase C-terminal domain-containing protein [Paraflavisolibacter caeni]MCU7550150.1 Gfo/Idh/MocA family oxidoreductase [Paraflavisolibacter caeni]
MKRIYFTTALILLFVISCLSQKNKTVQNIAKVRLITLDPGHFHAALVQKTMYPIVDPVVHVYAPNGSDVQLHLNRINAYNSRKEEPTKWKEKVYTGSDFLEKMLSEKAGNVVVISGNNKLKTEYIDRSLQGGFHVLADKPMVINSQNFELLKNAFQTAKDKNLLLYDIMTERFEITTILQKELSMIPEVFGNLQKGTPDQPAVTKESVHHFYKSVSGEILTRPAWFMDVAQQGEGIVDVTTHLVDLVQWECFPEQALDYTKDVQVLSAKRWPTEMTISEFKKITKLDTFPNYLKKDIVGDTILNIYSNGEINYTLRGVHAKVKVAWNYKAPEGAGDTHYSIMRGTKANLIIQQGAEQKYIPSLYVEPVNNNPEYENSLKERFKTIQTKYPRLGLKKTEKGWEVIIPDQYRESHEAHFARVMQNFLDYLKNGNMPAWEVPNMLAKYYTTTKGLEIALKNK